jgi:hypothetical protein
LGVKNGVWKSYPQKVEKIDGEIWHPQPGNGYAPRGPKPVRAGPGPHESDWQFRAQVQPLGSGPPARGRRGVRRRFARASVRMGVAEGGARSLCFFSVRSNLTIVDDCAIIPWLDLISTANLGVGGGD